MCEGKEDGITTSNRMTSLQSISKKKPGLTNAAVEKIKNKIQLKIYKNFVTNVE